MNINTWKHVTILSIWTIPLQQNMETLVIKGYEPCRDACFESTSLKSRS